MEQATPDDENSFLIKYWTAKVKLINELKLTNRYNSILVIEDDLIVCSMLHKLGFKVFCTEITKNETDQSLTVKFRPPQIRYMTELETLLKPRKKPLEIV